MRNNIFTAFPIIKQIPFRVITISQPKSSAKAQSSRNCESVFGSMPSPAPNGEFQSSWHKFGGMVHEK